jgi:hypothetical protein
MEELNIGGSSEAPALPMTVLHAADDACAIAYEPDSE